jgi:hypothetical protein
MHGKALWYVGPGLAELREEPVAAPTSDEVRVRALFGAISRGTERLVHSGRVPESEYERMRAPLMSGAFPFPVKYGYATVGRVEIGPAELQGQVVFSLHPHQDVFTLPAQSALPVPPGVAPMHAVLAANMETALNAIWDGAPGPADRIAIVGGGLRSDGGRHFAGAGRARACAWRAVCLARGRTDGLRRGVSRKCHGRRACGRAAACR